MQSETQGKRYIQRGKTKEKRREVPVRRELFKDLINGTGKSKASYSKIQFCGEQARRDGLQYFWVDTCCIDKSNSTELAEAINSMFRWYRDATRCYVYLSDVSSKIDPERLEIATRDGAFGLHRRYNEKCFRVCGKRVVASQQQSQAQNLRINQRY